MKNHRPALAAPFIGNAVVNVRAPTARVGTASTIWAPYSVGGSADGAPFYRPSGETAWT